MPRSMLFVPGLLLASAVVQAQETRLLREPTVSATHVAFAYGGDLWITGREGGEARRLTSTPAVESDPYLSPDGRWLAFTSNRSGNQDLYVMPVEGGDPQRLTWHPVPDMARGWTPDSRRVLFTSDRGTAPGGFGRLWTVPVQGGVPEYVPAPMAVRGSYAADGQRIVYDRADRWDVEWRNYRGGQNTPITVLALGDLAETRLPNERTTDTWPVWLGGTVYFLSDRDWATNVWAWDPASGGVRQVTRFRDADVKALKGGGGVLAFEQDGYIHLLDPATGQSRRLTITVRGDFPWAMPRWTDVSRSISSASLSPSGKRAVFEARGEIFTVPAEKGDPRNLTRSPGAADRSPIWSPDGTRLAWISDAGDGYRLLIGPQDGMSPPRTVSLGESKYAYESDWSPDGRRIAIVDERSRVRVIEVESGRIATIDTGGTLNDRGGMGITWSPDSRWLAYAKSFPNRFSRIVIWSAENGRRHVLTDAMADAVNPAWDRGGRYLYFLASTDLGLASSWANISGIGRTVTRGAYVTLLRATDSTPFAPESDEEGVARDSAQGPARGASRASDTVTVTVDPEGIARRILSLQMPVRNYSGLAAGERGVLFIREGIPNQPGTTVHRYELSKRKAESFMTGVNSMALSADGKKMLVRSGQNWSVVGTATSPRAGDGRLSVNLQARLDPAEEWPQIFDDAWRKERDFFYAPNTHGADWNAVRDRYHPLVQFVRHRSDLNYVLDQVGGELSVGHSFTGGGDMPPVDTTRVGLLGADFVPDRGRWQISRIYTGESWNPELQAPLDAPGLRVAAGHYLLAVNGAELAIPDSPWRLLDGTADRQTVLTLNTQPTMDGAWTVTVVPLRNENGLRTRAWVEDNRRLVDSLSGGRLAYVWVPNTGTGGYLSFNRYFFAQQDRLGAVIDERFNGGGLLDDYMVDYMSRRYIGGITNDVPGGVPYRLPGAGVMGPKVMLINERAGSGGDYFPWAFRQLGIGPLIGTRTWGGLVASCGHYPLVDGGNITAPCSAVFGMDNNWVAENEGVPPDIEVPLDARSAADGRDVQLERAVTEALRLLETGAQRPPARPAFPVRARRPGGN